MESIDVNPVKDSIKGNADITLQVVYSFYFTIIFRITSSKYKY